MLLNIITTTQGQEGGGNDHFLSLMNSAHIQTSVLRRIVKDKHNISVLLLKKKLHIGKSLNVI